MPSHHYELTALPVVVPLAVLVFAFMLRRLRRRDSLTALRAMVGAILCIYGAGVVGNTLLPIAIGATPSDLPWWSHINFIPLVNTEPVDMIENVLVFLPLGILLPLVTRVRSLGAVILVGFLVSLAMELLQLLNALVAEGGHIADVNDLLANTVGAPIGYGLYRAALLLPALARLAGASRWPVSTDDGAIIRSGPGDGR